MAQTLEAGTKEKEVFAISPQATFFIFNKVSPDIDDKIKSTLENCTFKIEGKVYDNEYKMKLKKVMSKFDVKNCPEELKPLIRTIQYVYNQCNAWDGLLKFPPQIIKPSEDAKTVTYILIDLIRSIKIKVALDWVKWLEQNLIPEEYRSVEYFKSSYIKAISPCYRKRKMFKDETIFWAVLDVHNHFKLYDTTNEKLRLHMEADIGSIKLSRSGKTVKLFDRTGVRVKRIIPLDPSHNEMWVKAMNLSTVPKFPYFLSKNVKPYPDLLLFALNEALLAPDRVALRTLTHFQVSKVSNGVELAGALFDIFAYAGKVNELLTVMAANEFASPELTINTVLRGNSHLTNLFKVFFRRYGREYYDKFLKRIVLYIDSKGDLKIKTPADADSQKVQTMVFTVLKRVAGSLQHVPLEIRHFASILKLSAARRFNSKQATYNTLSGFFCLRYISSILSNPLEYDKDLKLQNQWIKVMVPAAQLLMTPFNLIQMNGKFEVFNSWNKSLTKNIFPKLIEFVFSVGVCNETPIYQPPTKERLIESLQIVLNKINESDGAFVTYFKKFASEPHCTSLSASFVNFLTGYFEEAIEQNK